MINKALSFQPDVFIPDMEDSVPDSEKVNAREVVADHLKAFSGTGRVVIPRLNSMQSGHFEDDLRAVVGPDIAGISVGKIDRPEDVIKVSQLMLTVEREHGLEAGQLRIIPWLESASAIVHAFEILSADRRVVAAAFGAEDFTHDMGIRRVGDESEVGFARQSMCIAARAAGVPALDTPYFSFRDEQGLRENIAASKQCGFKGKFAIHPAQVEIINGAFAPSIEEIDYARRVVAAFEEAERNGRGSTSLDGLVIDVPVVKRARALLGTRRWPVV
ncbi:MAG: CoA ester lyase [Gammaproteobacteria bacterium]|nr:MAG: CoA ester lyase [Gammaproteobacteria bacterium]